MPRQQHTRSRQVHLAIDDLLRGQHSSVGCLCFIWKKKKYYWEDMHISSSMDGIKLAENFKANLKSPISVPMLNSLSNWSPISEANIKIHS